MSKGVRFYQKQFSFWLWWNLRDINVYSMGFCFRSISIMTMSIWYSTLFALCSMHWRRQWQWTKKIYTIYIQSMNNYGTARLYECRWLGLCVCALVFGFRAVYVCSGKESVKTFRACFFIEREKKQSYSFGCVLFVPPKSNYPFFRVLETDNLWLNYFVLILPFHKQFTTAATYLHGNAFNLCWHSMSMPMMCGSKIISTILTNDSLWFLF